jgi:hypothetical protein
MRVQIEIRVAVTNITNPENFVGSSGGDEDDDDNHHHYHHRCKLKKCLLPVKVLHKWS